MRILAVLFGIILILVGVLAGGCSLVFSPMMFDSGMNIEVVWFAGLGLGVVGIWGGSALLRGRKVAAPVPPITGSDESAEQS